MPSPASRMNKAQQSLIEDTLRRAFADHHTFSGVGDVKEHLLYSGVSEVLISAHIEEIFDCYIRLISLRAEPYIGQQAERTPPHSDDLPVRASNKTVAGGTCADTNSLATPVFHSDEILNISFFRQRLNSWHPAVAKICEGSISFISEALVLRNHLDRNKSSIVISWRYTTGVENNEIADTRCVVVKPEVLADCEIALAEDCGKVDPEDLIDDDEDDGADDEDISDLRSESIPNDIVPYQSLAARTIQSLSPEEKDRVTHRTTAMNLQAALMLEISPRPQTLRLTRARLHEQSRRSARGPNMS